MTTLETEILTPTDALRLLGLPEDPCAPPPDPLTLRKAYVRAIKRYSPESNPQEFQRVRSAYELLEERRKWAEYDDDDDASSDAASEAEVPKEPRAELHGPDALEDAPRPAYVGPPLPPWRTTLDDLTAILTDAGVMQDGVRARAPISETSRKQLASLIWLGWPETLDQPLVRFAARLFELGHTYEGHLLLERLLSATEHPPVARGAYPDAYRARLAGISREVRERGESAQLGWVFGPDHVEAEHVPQEDPTPLSENAKRLLVVLVFVLISAGVTLTKERSGRTSGSRASPSTWVEDTCKPYPSVCGEARDLARVIREGYCGRIVPELESLGAVLTQTLRADDANVVMRKAHREAHSTCPKDLAPEPATIGGRPP